ncbi:hypothetical protein DGG96_00645 [Legionella qingyii]|uniref:Coiled-coil protein n=1 Tax=Legionella qingyii TaxID=2184757 RepID=A0A317U9R0_9GAMM|nr:hypothetical protein [Legionella qingyii]PWY57636.1 hypothetical protein DGG96_00645 [Legionella qingyii]RUR25896.1 hypothetical protein ELY20_01745 [Legionella qingyii]RUR29286.1 hypothetical protein ELY16_00370 [Legionella qingyii]
MGKKATSTRLANGNNKAQKPYSNQDSQLFFNQNPMPPSPEIQETQKNEKIQHPIQEISIQTTTDILLAAILQELKTQNMIELMKLKAQQEQEQEELLAAEKMQEHDDARFDEIRTSMYI